MATLYIDCDDTLVKWFDHSLGSRLSREEGVSWSVNKEVVAAAERWHAAGLGQIVVWSGGGRSYAEQWGHELLSHLPHVALFKDPRIVKADDVVIDDAKFSMAGTMVDPAMADTVAFP